MKTPSPPPNSSRKTYAESVAGMEKSPEVTLMASSMTVATLATLGAMKRELRRQERVAKERDVRTENSC